MKIKHDFKSRQQAVNYLAKRGWKLSTIFPATGVAILTHEASNALRGVRQLAGLPVKWVIDRDQTFLRHL